MYVWALGVHNTHYTALHWTPCKVAMRLRGVFQYNNDKRVYAHPQVTTSNAAESQ